MTAVTKDNLFVGTNGTSAWQYTLVTRRAKVYIPVVKKGWSPAPPVQWVTIVNEGFEGGFPSSGWEVRDNDSASGYYYWGKRNCRASNGSYSAWSVGAGDSALSCGSNYPNDVFAWMIYGPFSLADATAAEWIFDWWSDTELDYDVFFWGVSVNGTNYYGTSVTGNWASWTLDEVVDLSNVYTLGNLLGAPNVWVAFMFGADDVVTDRGSFIDNVLVRKCTSGSCPSASGAVSAPAFGLATGTRTNMMLSLDSKALPENSESRLP